MVPSAKRLFILLTSLTLIISSSIAQPSFRPKALVLPITKDISAPTPQYIVQIKQRTPLVPIKLTLDLGGGYFWVNCDKDSYLSSTSKPIHCNSSQSQCTLFGVHGCYENMCSSAAYNTVTGAVTSGPIHSDVVSIQSTNGKYPTRYVSVPNFLFICPHSSDVVLNGLANGVQGMAGLGKTKVSFPSQFSSAFSISRKFAICLSSSTFPNSNGVLFFGDGPYNLNSDVSKVLIYTPLITNHVSAARVSNYKEPSLEYFIGVKSIRVSNKNVKLNTTLLSIDKNGYGGTKISTVNPYTIMESSIYKALADAFVKELGVPTVKPVEPFGTCFASKDISFSRMGPDVPSIDFVLQNENVVWNIIGANAMVSLDNDVICLGFVDGGPDSKDTQVGYVFGGAEPMTSITIGAHQLENNLLQFDLATSRLGFRSLFLEHDNCQNFNFTSSV